MKQVASPPIGAGLLLPKGYYCSKCQIKGPSVSSWTELSTRGFLLSSRSSEENFNFCHLISVMAK